MPRQELKPINLVANFPVTTFTPRHTCIEMRVAVVCVEGPASIYLKTYQFDREGITISVCRQE